MSKRWINALQNVVIALLFMLMLLLLLQVQGAGQRDIGALWESLSAPDAQLSPVGGEKTEGRGIAPVHMVLSGSYGRCGYTQITTHSEAYENAGTLLNEAVGSAGARVRISAPAFERALSENGVYFDFLCALPSELLFGQTLEGEKGALSAVRRALLAADGDGQYVSFYVQDEKQGFFSFPTAVSAQTLAEHLASVESDNVFFAFEWEGAERLVPYAILPAQTPQLFVLAAADPITTTSHTDAILSALDFNPHTQSRYTETSGASVILDDDRSLRIYPDGTVRFEGAADDACTLLQVDARGDAPALSEMAGACRTLLETLLAAVGAQTQVYLSAVEQDGQLTRLAFDYMVEGMAVRFSNGTHAAELVVEGQTVTGFSLRLRNYVPQADAVQLLPMAQVLPIAARYDRSEPAICYLDGGGERVSADWVVK